MNVRELIEVLSKMDPERAVVICEDDKYAEVYQVLDEYVFWRGDVYRVESEPWPSDAKRCVVLER